MKHLICAFSTLLLIACQQTPPVTDVTPVEPTNVAAAVIIDPPVQESPTIVEQPHKPFVSEQVTTESSLLAEKFETCKNQLGVLAQYDKRQFKTYERHLNDNVAAISAYLAVRHTLPQESATFLEYQHRLALDVTCTKIQGALNSAILQKVPSLN